MSWKSLDEMDMAGKRVLTRVDINVPIEDGLVSDTTRIDRIVPTVRDIIGKGGKLCCWHISDGRKERLSWICLCALSCPRWKPRLGIQSPLIETLDGAENLTDEARSADVILLENIRFYPGEEANDPEFARRLSALGDVYCNDAFSAAHRAHASTEGVAHFLPSCAGRLMQAELQALEAALGSPKRPVAAVVGGAKVSSKLDLLGNLVGK